MITKRFPGFARELVTCCTVLILALQLGTQSAAARDAISGFEKKFVEVVAGKIYRGIQPGDDEDYAFLASRGIRTQINLRKYIGWQERDMHEESELHGFFYRHTGMPTMWMAPKESEVAETLAYINDPSLQPVYVHCRLGKDRTGMIIALYRVLYQQWDACTAWKEWASFGYKAWNSGLKDYYESRLRRETHIPNYDPVFRVSQCR